MMLLIVIQRGCVHILFMRSSCYFLLECNCCYFFTVMDEESLSTS